MRKISASILLLALAALFIEAAQLPLRCFSQKQTACAMMKKMHANCPKMAAMMKKHNQKKGRCSTNYCPDCPLFAVSTFKEMINLVTTHPISNLEYSVMITNNLSEYYSQPWKPPNFPFF